MLTASTKLTFAPTLQNALDLVADEIQKHNHSPKAYKTDITLCNADPSKFDVQHFTYTLQANFTDRTLIQALIQQSESLRIQFRQSKQSQEIYLENETIWIPIDDDLKGLTKTMQFWISFLATTENFSNKKIQSTFYDFLQKIHTYPNQQDFDFVPVSQGWFKTKIFPYKIQVKKKTLGKHDLFTTASIKRSDQNFTKLVDTFLNMQAKIEPYTKHYFCILHTDKNQDLDSKYNSQVTMTLKTLSFDQAQALLHQEQVEDAWIESPTLDSPSYRISWLSDGYEIKTIA